MRIDDEPEVYSKRRQHLEVLIPMIILFLTALFLYLDPAILNASDKSANQTKVAGQVDLQDDQIPLAPTGQEGNLLGGLVALVSGNERTEVKAIDPAALPDRPLTREELSLWSSASPDLRIDRQRPDQSVPFRAYWQDHEVIGSYTLFSENGAELTYDRSASLLPQSHLVDGLGAGRYIVRLELKRQVNAEKVTSVYIFGIQIAADN